MMMSARLLHFSQCSFTSDAAAALMRCMLFYAMQLALFMYMRRVHSGNLEGWQEEMRGREPLGALPDGQVALPDGNSAKFEYTLFLACLGPAPAV